MASSLEVKQYLAHWFQLGRKVLVHNGDVALLPSKIFSETNYSAEFDRCWELILSDESGDCYLEDTTQTIEELLTPKWDLLDCARCTMPVPVPIAGTAPETCPCVNLPHWPNQEVPSPRSQPAGKSKLLNIHDRLKRLTPEG